MPAAEAAQLQRFLAANALGLGAALFALQGSYLGHGLVPATWVDHVVFVAWCALLLVLLVALLATAARASRVVLPALGWRLLYPLLLGTLPVALWLDVRAFRALDIHLYSPEMVHQLHRTEYLHEARIELSDVLAVLGAYAAALVVEALLLVALRPRRAATRSRLGRSALAVAGLGFVSAAVLLAGRSRVSSPRSPLGRALPFHDLLFGGGARVREFHVLYPPREAAKASELPAPANPPNLVVLAVESLRDDAASPAHMPQTLAYMSQHSCWRSPQHVSSSHLTELSVFSLLYGLDASRLDAFRTASVPSLALARLHDAGFRLRGEGSSPLLNYHGAGFALAGMAPYREHVSSSAWRDDAAVADALVDDLGQARTAASPDAAPLFLFAFFNSTHFPYAYPPEGAHHLPAAEQLHGIGASPELRTPVKNRYANAVEYLDTQLARTLAAVPEGSWVVVTGDHAEELWDAGGYGHLAARFDDARVQVPLYICAPWASALTAQLSGHADLLPTLLDALGLLPDPASFDGRSLRRAPATEPMELVNGDEYPNRGETMALLRGGKAARSCGWSRRSTSPRASPW